MTVRPVSPGALEATTLKPRPSRYKNVPTSAPHAAEAAYRDLKAAQANLIFWPYQASHRTLVLDRRAKN
jgi:hypothetical protein